jgi:hypothetical protein
VSPEDGKRPQETKRQAVTRLFRQKTDSKSRNHLRSSRRYKITHLRRGSLERVSKAGSASNHVLTHGPVEVLIFCHEEAAEVVD